MESIVYKLRAKCDMEEIELRFGCTTNATLLNENRLAFISKEIDDFTISMDGAKWTQNYSRPLKSGGESFDIVEKWLKRTLDIFPNLRVRMTFNHKTVGSGIDKKNRDRLLTYSDKFNEACVGCDLYDFCEQTRCKIVNKLLTGEFCTPSPIVCAENHLLLELN